MVEVNSGKTVFIDKLTQKRIENWCGESDVAFRNMAEQIRTEKPNVQYELNGSGIYVLRS